MRDAKPRIRIGDVSTADGKVSFMLEDPSQVDAAREALLPALNGNGTVREWDLQVFDGNRFVLTQTQKGLDQAVNDGDGQPPEKSSRKRIDALGTKRADGRATKAPTASWSRCRACRIRRQLKDLLGKTAELDFKLVDQTALPSDIAQGIVPRATRSCLSRRAPAGAGTTDRRQAPRRHPRRRADQRPATNKPQTNEPVVNITFDSQGGASSPA